MLSGVKFIPRNKINQAEHDSDSSPSTPKKKKKQQQHKSHAKRRKYYSSSSDISDEEDRKYRKRRSKKNYSSSSDLSDEEERKYRKRKSKKKAKWESPSSSENDVSEEKYERRKRKSKRSSRQRSEEEEETSGSSEDERKVKFIREDTELARKEMGLEWMVRPSERPTVKVPEEPPPEVLQEEEPKSNPKELNPHFKEGGSGYPEDDDFAQQKAVRGQFRPPSIVGDGGASWRLKALKRAKEQAAREGRKLDEVVEERWGSLAQMTATVASTRAAHARSHLHAIRERKGEQRGERENPKNGDNDIEQEMDDKMTRNNSRDYLREISHHGSRMKAPKIHDSLSWRNKRNAHLVRPEDAELIRIAASSLNQFTNDGNFFQNFNKLQNKEHEISPSAVDFETDKASGDDLSTKGKKSSSDAFDQKYESKSDSHKAKATVVDRVANVQGLTANHLAAKAMQLRLKGKHAEADELLKESQNVAKAAQCTTENIVHQADTSRLDVKNLSAWSKQKAEDDADSHLASMIIHNKQFSTNSQADDEYDFDNITGRKGKKSAKKEQTGKNTAIKIEKRILTQQERCNLCFDNSSRPKHLTISIANFTYLMLPPWEPVVSGHCYILPVQHESSTRNLDDNVWEELRNFKKCLLRMFAEEEKDVLFMETVIGLSQQRRHCLVECIPLPHDVAKEAPLYFKKAIDEAEEEWSQHNAKKLIDTSVKGLRGSIPKNFPYFHVEFGLQKGFVHVIDDEKNFRSQFGLNVIRGMLQLREEDMYRRRQHYSVEMQHKAALDFSRKWEPFDWTKMLD